MPFNCSTHSVNVKIVVVFLQMIDVNNIAPFICLQCRSNVSATLWRQRDDETFFLFLENLLFVDLFIIFGFMRFLFLDAKNEIEYSQNRISLTPSDGEYIRYDSRPNEGHLVICGGDADDNLKWLTPHGMEVNYKGRVHVEKVNGQLRLIFESIKLEDQGEWTCVSEFEEGGDGKSFIMNVYGDF